MNLYVIMIEMGGYKYALLMNKHSRTSFAWLLEDFLLSRFTMFDNLTVTEKEMLQIKRR